MKKINSLLLITVSVLIFSATSAFAKHKNKVLEGEYIPVSGWAESMEVSRPALFELPNQLGEFKLKLKRKDWDDLSDEDQDRIAKKVTIEGIFRGAMQPNMFFIDHTFVNEKRTGVMYTDSDFLILPLITQGDPNCSSGVPLAGTEKLNFVSGSGDYEDLRSGEIFVKGVINNCPGQPDFLQNDFVVEKNWGSLIFGPE